MRSQPCKTRESQAGAASSITSWPPLAPLTQWVSAPGQALAELAQRPAPIALRCPYGHYRRSRHLPDPHRTGRTYGLDSKNRPHPALSCHPQPRPRSTPARRPARTRPSIWTKPRLARRHHHRLAAQPPRPRRRGRTAPHHLNAAPRRHFTPAQSLTGAPPPQGCTPTRTPRAAHRQHCRADHYLPSSLFRGSECASALDPARAPPHKSADMKKCRKYKHRTELQQIPGLMDTSVNKKKHT